MVNENEHFQFVKIFHIKNKNIGSFSVSRVKTLELVQEKKIPSF